MQNDIAFCTVSRSFDFSNGKVAPACLPDNSQKNYRNGECYATGFGTLNEGAMTGSIELMAVKVAIEPIVNCVHPYNHEVKADYHICAGGTQGQDSCQGDSGGPFVCEIPEEDVTEYQNKYCRHPSGNGDGRSVVKILSGIISFGKGCGRAGVPGVYVNIWNENYRQFIMSTVNNTMHNPYLGGSSDINRIEQNLPWVRDYGGAEYMGQVQKVGSYDNNGYYTTPASEKLAKYQAMLALYKRLMAQQAAAAAERRRQQQVAAMGAQRPSHSSYSSNRRPTNQPNGRPTKIKKKRKKKSRWGRSIESVRDVKIDGPMTMRKA